MSNFYSMQFPFARSKKILFAVVLLMICSTGTTRAQVAAGDIAFVGYNMVDNMTTTASVNDSFSFIALADIPNSTVIYFTDFGWRSDAAAFATSCSGSGSTSDGVISWTANQLVTAGTIVWVSCKTAPFASNYGNVAGVSASFGTPSDYMSLGTAGDQIIAYTGTFGSPTLITAIQLTKASWDATYTSCEFSATKSVLPAALSSNNLAFLTGTTNARNGHFNCATLTGTAADKRAIIYNTSNWTFDVATIPGSGPFGPYASHCVQYAPANVAPTFTGGSPQSLTVCQNAAATAINSYLTVNDPDAGQTETWTVSASPSHGSIVTGTTHASGTGVSPTGFTYQPTAGYSGSDAFTIQVSDGNGGTASTTINVTITASPAANAGSAVSAICQGGTTAALGGSFSGSATSAIWNDGGAGGSFTNNGGSTPNTTTYTASVSSGSPVTLTLVTSGGSCGTTSANKSLTVNPNPVANAGSAVSAICQGGTTAALGGSFSGGATSAIWNDGGAGGSFTNNGGSTPNTTTYTASASSSSPVTLTLVTAGGSCGTTSANKSLTVNANPAANAGSAVSAICQGGTTAALGGSFSGGATSAVWNDGGAGGSFTNNGGSTPNTTTYTASASSSSPVTLTLVTSGGSCGTTSANKSLTVNPNPVANAGSAVSAICQGGTTTALGGSFSGGATSAVWNDGGAGGSFTNNSGNTPNTTTYTASASSSSPVTLTLVTSGGSCGTTSANKSLTVNANPVANAGSAVSAICQGGTTTALGGSFSGGVTSAVWNDGGAGGSFTNNSGNTPNTTTYTASASSSSPVTLTLVTAGGSCGTTSANKSLTVNANPAVNAGSAVSAICQGGTTAALGGSFSGGATSAVWNDGGAGGSFTNNSGNTPNTTTYTASASSSSPVTLTLVTAGGSCGTTSANKSLTVNVGPAVGAGSALSAICQGGTTAALGGSFGGSATSAVWNDGGAGGSFTNNGGTTPNTTTYTASSSSASPVTLTLVTGGGSCGTTSAGKLLMVDAPATTNAGSALSAICQGGTTAALGGSYGGGASSAIWDDGGAGGSFANNTGATPATTTYTASAASSSPVTLTLTANGGACGSVTDSKQLTVNSNPTVNAGSALSAICQGGTTVALGGSFGGGATSAIWNDNGAGGSFTNNSGTTPSTTIYTASSSSVATVTLTLTTGGGSCGVLSAGKLLTVNPNPTVSAGSALSAICQGGTTAVLGGSFGGGATSAVWNDGGSGGSFTNNSGNDPSVTTYTASSSALSTVTLTLVTSGGSCGAMSAGKPLTVNPNPTVNAGSALSAICQAGSTAALGGSFGGGATMAVWSDNGAGGSFTNNGGATPSTTIYTASSSSVSTVTLTLTTSGGSCGVLSASKLLTVNPNPAVSAGGALSAICQGGTTAALGGSFGGGATSAVWNDGGAGGSFANNTGSDPSITTYTASSSALTTVTLTLVAGGGSCGTPSASKPLTVNPNPTVSAGSATSAICQGNTTAALGGSFGGGATSALWSDGGAGGSFANNSGATPSAATYTASAFSPAGITLTLTTAGGACGNAFASKSLTIHQTPAIDDMTTNAPVCAGLTLNLGSTASGGTGTLVYEWSGPSLYSATGDNQSITSVTTAAGGTYTLVVSDVNGCSVTDNIAATIRATPQITSIGNNAPVCEENMLALSSTITGGTGVYGYQWNGPNSFTSTDEDPTVTSSATIAANGTYTLVVTDVNTCVATGTNTTSVTVHAIQPIVGATSILFGQTITLSDPVAGGSWSTPTPWTTRVTPSGGVVKGISAGISVISYTTAQGCVATYTVSVISGINACVGQTIALSDNGMSGGSWSSGAASIATVNTNTGVLTGVSAGKVVITYRTSPTVATTTTVTVNPLLPTSMSSAIACQGQSISLTNTTAGGGTWYSGNTSIAMVSTNGAVSGLAGGVVDIYFTPVAGCVTVKTLTITPVSPITGPTNVCVSSTIALSNSTPGGTWYSSVGAQATVTVGGGIVYGVAAGKPTIFYVWPNGCWASSTITVNPLVQTTTGTTGVMCQGASIAYSNTTMGGGVWTTGNASVATVNSAGLVAGAGGGSTHVIFTTPAGCVATRTVTVNGVPTISGVTSVCMGQTTQLSSSATTGFWSSSSAALATVSTSGLVKGIASGAPRISYIMPTGCNSTLTVTVNTLNPITGGTAAMCQSGTMTLANSTPFGGAWTSSNTSIATVNSGGVVRGAGAGMTIISFTSSVGSCVATRTVTVNACRQAGSTSVGQTEEVLTELKLFPNPNNGLFTLQGNIAGDDEVVAAEVVNMLGQVVYAAQLSVQNGQINEYLNLGDKLSKGSYILKLRSANGGNAFHFVVN